ncbi:MAG TPA: hypothetical protein VGM03_20280 [Phycisphaerae bacterium]|jgi:hypothetical protein
MKLPNADRAVVEIEKLTDYCLSPHHLRGRHKARVFAAVLGLTAADADALRDALMDAAQSQEVVLGETDDFGQRYVLDFLMRGARGTAAVRSTWIVRRGEDFPRLTSCYVL